MLRRSFDWLFRDRESGDIVLGQFPNPSLWIAMALFGGRWVAARAEAPSWLQTGLDWVFTAVILWWAGRELLQGVNPFRRGVGLMVILLVLGSRLM